VLPEISLLKGREVRVPNPARIEDPPYPNNTMSSMLNNSEKTTSIDTEHCGS